MSRRHISPIHIPATSQASSVLTVKAAVSEDFIQDLVHRHPAALPIEEIDAAFAEAIPVCRELNTPAGPIDNFLVTPSGLPVIVECKLWRNPQARREVIGQVLDYAKELSRWTSADIEREAARRGVPSLIDLVRAHDPVVDEAAFHDGLTTSLVKGRCLLLILGDGIRQGVEAIFDHLQTQGALQFSFGLVEFPVYQLPDGSHLAVPSVLARSHVRVREVIALPLNHTLEPEEADIAGLSTEVRQVGDERRAFWENVLRRLRLDDPEQPIGSAPRLPYTTFALPVADRSCWILIYRDMLKGQVGIALSWGKNGIGQKAVELMMERVGTELLGKLGGGAVLGSKDSTPTLREIRHFGNLSDPEVQDEAASWLAVRVNDFLNVIRPSIRAAAMDLQEMEQQG